MHCHVCRASPPFANTCCFTLFSMSKPVVILDSYELLVEAHKIEETTFYINLPISHECVINKLVRGRTDVC